MPRFRLPAALVGAALFFVFGAGSLLAHLDAPRTPLSQLFLEADFVAIALIETVERRNFDLDGARSSYEVITAQVSDHYKGEQQQRIEFFQYAHGHAHYQPGDLAVLFLEKMDDGHQLSAIGKSGRIQYVSHQVRNTEHRLDQRDVANYQWVLGAYAEPASAGDADAVERSKKLRNILLWMLESDSPKLAESALLDWSHAGDAIRFSQDEVNQLVLLVADESRPIGYRLALLQELSRRHLVSAEPWQQLLNSENEANLILALRSVANYENRDLKNDLVALLDRPSPFVAESAAMALASPVYAGAESALQGLMESENQRLNYAAVDGLLGIDTLTARNMLTQASLNHPNPNVRRLIVAKKGIARNP